RTHKPYGGKFLRLSPSFALQSTYLAAAKANKIHYKFFRRKVRGSYKRADFSRVEPKLLRNIRIFKIILAMNMGKYAAYNLMCSTLLRLSNILQEKHQNNTIFSAQNRL
ncbi:MAG: hypothetical protein J6L87_00085, partial [Clostridia bacterium]|nr:hypothetical protein [Clostridia bacterium]